MSASRKLAVAVTLIAAFSGVFGCGGKKDGKTTSRPAVIPAAREEPDDAPPQAELEANCFEGDQSACDELGH